MNGRRYRIGISGSYGGMNHGDEAILEGILSQLRATISADITGSWNRARHRGQGNRRSVEHDRFNDFMRRDCAPSRGVARSADRRS